jgi:hypothetical protein
LPPTLQSAGHTLLNPDLGCELEKIRAELGLDVTLADVIRKFLREGSSQRNPRRTHRWVLVAALGFSHAIPSRR